MPNLNRSYPPADAERGKFAPLTDADLTTLGMTSSASRGRYALLTYSISIPNTAQEIPLSIAAWAMGTATFTKAPLLIEVTNNSATQNIFLSFSSTTAATVSANGIKIKADTSYAIEQAATTARIVADGSGTADVRVV